MPSLGSLTLPPDPVWTDELEWTDVEIADASYGETGSYIIQYGIKQSGRPITLDCAWMSRAEVLTLQAMASGGLPTYTLVIAQGTFSVVFRKPPFIMKPIRDVSDPDASEMYKVTLNLVTV